MSTRKKCAVLLHIADKYTGPDPAEARTQEEAFEKLLACKQSLEGHHSCHTPCATKSICILAGSAAVGRLWPQAAYSTGHVLEAASKPELARHKLVGDWALSIDNTQLAWGHNMSSCLHLYLQAWQDLH